MVEENVVVFIAVIVIIVGVAVHYVQHTSACKNNNYSYQFVTFVYGVLEKRNYCLLNTNTSNFILKTLGSKKKKRKRKKRKDTHFY